MQTRLELPQSRLICFGSAKACTNQGVGQILEADPEEGFDD
ncbi:MAG: hypothetical protein ACK41C_02475 [Phenylobacterium sp.]